MAFELLVGCSSEREAKKLLPIICRRFHIPKKFMTQGFSAAHSAPNYKHFGVFYAFDDHDGAHRRDPDTVTAPGDIFTMQEFGRTVQLGMRAARRR